MKRWSQLPWTLWVVLGWCVVRVLGSAALMACALHTVHNGPHGEFWSGFRRSLGRACGDAQTGEFTAGHAGELAFLLTIGVVLAGVASYGIFAKSLWAIRLPLLIGTLLGLARIGPCCLEPLLLVLAFLPATTNYCRPRQADPGQPPPPAANPS